MPKPQATNSNIWVIRDETPSESYGLILPTEGRTKPHTGTIFSIGKLTQDENIKKALGKKAIFHQTVGQEIEYEGVTYLIIASEHILGIDESSK